MVQYIIQLAQAMITQASPPRTGDYLQLREPLAEELNRLDPRDFEPDARYDFVLLRAEARRHARVGMFSGDELPQKLVAMAQKLIEVLNKYGNALARPATRDFPYIQDPDLKRIIQRDYRELVVCVHPSGAWKSTVVLAGSILEAILQDQLRKDSATEQLATASPAAPAGKGGIAAGRWTLDEMIKVAVDIHLLPADRAGTFDQVLRDYRNFVHPKKELRAQHSCGEGEALMAVGALMAVCEVLG